MAWGSLWEKLHGSRPPSHHCYPFPTRIPLLSQLSRTPLWARFHATPLGPWSYDLLEDAAHHTVEALVDPQMAWTDLVHPHRGNACSKAAFTATRIARARRPAQYAYAALR